MSNCSASSVSVRSPSMAASATFALKAGVWFRRGRLCMVAPDSQGTACPSSGRNSTYRPVQISGTTSALRHARPKTLDHVGSAVARAILERNKKAAGRRLVILVIAAAPGVEVEYAVRAEYHL